MFILILLIILNDPITVRASSDRNFLPASTFVSRLLNGFKDHPLVVWTNSEELFPELADILVKESYQANHPIELWLESHARWREHLKFEPGKPLYLIFPPSLGNYSKNLMLNMLSTFTDCQFESEAMYFRQINDDVFLFVSDKYDGSQENPAAMQDTKTNCATPPQLLFLKYKLRAVTRTWIQLESLYALRMRCYDAYGGACAELVAKDDTYEILSWLSSHQVRNIVQVEWAKIEQPNIFIVGLSESDVIDKHGWKWDELKALYFSRRRRDLRGSAWTIMRDVEYFELAAKVNITLTASSEAGHFETNMVGLIGTRSIGEGDYGISPSTCNLIGGSHFEIIYRAPSRTQLNPLAGKSLAKECGWLESGIILGLALIITAILTPKKRPQEFLNIVINLFAPLLLQGPPHKVPGKHKLLFYLWVLLLWFVSSLYISLLQSERVVPTTQQGNETLEDQLERGKTFYAGYRAYAGMVYGVKRHRMARYSTKDRKLLWQFANVLYKSQYYNLPLGVTREFFKLSTFGLLVESWEVRPLSRVLTSFYKKDYEILGEKVFEQFEWAQIHIPQRNDVAVTYERLRVNGIREYWHQATVMARELKTEDVMRRRLHFQKVNWDDAVFQPVDTTDSVFIEILTLWSLILSLSASLFVGRLAWTRVKEWRRSKVKKLCASKEVDLRRHSNRKSYIRPH